MTEQGPSQHNRQPCPQFKLSRAEYLINDEFLAQFYTASRVLVDNVEYPALLFQLDSS